MSAGVQLASTRSFPLFSTGVPSFSLGVLSFSRFLLIEYKGERAKEGLELFQSILKGKAAVQNGDSSQVNVAITSKLAEEIADNSKNKNNFSQVEIQLSLLSSLEYSDDYKNKATIETSWEGGESGNETIERFLHSVTDFLSEKGLIFLLLTSYNTNTNSIQSFLARNNNLIKLVKLYKKKLMFESLYLTILQKNNKHT